MISTFHSLEKCLVPDFTMEQLYLISSTLWLVLCCGRVWCATELLKNPGFESGVNEWRSHGFSMTTESKVVHGGIASVKCTGRTHSYNGPGQGVQVTRGKRYAFRSHIKLVSDLQGHKYQTAQAKIRLHYKDDDSVDYFFIGRRDYLTADSGWARVGGDFQVPNRDIQDAYLYIEGLDAGVEFYFDDTTLTEIPNNKNWESEANQRIDNLRKSNIHFKFNVGSNFNVNDLQVQIDHTKHLFGFGSMVRSENFVNDDYKQYQNIVYHMFNWVTNEDFKWHYDKGTQGHPDYSVATAATNELVKNGMKVRGHTMFWAVEGHEPKWVKPMKGAQLKSAIDEHIKYMTGITRGKLSHWDVNNELLHGHTYEERTGDPNYTRHIFQQVHKSDSKPTLFLNDYNVMSKSEYTLAYLDQILELKSANVGLGGVGVQSHLKDFTGPDVHLLKARLDHLAEAGLPIWITELTLGASNENDKANWYERLLRLYFSHPGVEGVLFWGFWDHDVNVSPQKALIHGYTYTLDEAGKRFLHLTKEEWSTHVKRSLSSGKSFTVRGFHGDYDVVVYYKGKPIKRSTFSLGKGDKTVNIDIDGNGAPITLPAKIDPFKFKPTDHDPSTTSQGLHTVATATAHSQDSQLRCETRWSAISAAGDDVRVEKACHDNQVLTSCSSYLKNGDWHRDGEQIVMKNGRATCTAVNGYQSSAGIQAVARCCSLKGLSCTYKNAGPSGTGIDDQVVLPCSDSQYPLGCSTWTYNLHSDGSFPSNRSCISQNDDPAAGVMGYAACCQGSQLKCSIQKSGTSGQGQGETARVTCPPGNVMTGCSVFSKYGKAAGSYMMEEQGKDVCIAVNGNKKYGGEIGVQAFATCCHV